MTLAMNGWMAVFAGFAVMWLIAVAPVQFGAVTTGTVESGAHSSQRTAAIRNLSLTLVISVGVFLLQLLRGTDTLAQALALGLLVSILPVSARVGAASRANSLPAAMLRIVLLFVGIVLCSVTVYLVRS